MSNRYGADRIRKGLLHFLLGKGFSSIAGLVAMILVVRALSPAEFAAYSVLIALVEIVGALSGIGIPQIIQRYVPDLYQKRHDHSLRRVVVLAVCVRFSTLLAMTLAVHALAAQLAPALGIEAFVPELQLFMALVLFRAMAASLSQILDSTLHQGSAQLAFLAASVVRLIGISILTIQGEATLARVIAVEAATDLLCALLMLYGIVRQILLQPRGAQSDSADPGLASRARNILTFGASGYLQHLSILPYGSHTNRLIGGSMLATAAMASFGFAQALVLYLKNYLPVQLIGGLIRPILIARYSQTGDFSAAARLCQQSLKINILLLGFVFVGAFVAGEQVFLFVSAGKYGLSALMVFLGLVVVLILETQRQQLDLLSMTVERYAPLIPSNLLLSSSALLAVLLVPVCGAIAFPVANGIGLVASNGFVQSRLHRAGYRFRHDWSFTVRVSSTVLLSTAVGVGLQALGVLWWLALVLAMVIHGVLQLVFTADCIFQFARELSEEPAPPMPLPGSDSSTTQMRVAFGVLSSRDSAAAIDQIARAVFPNPVYVHHDFSKYPDYSPQASNVIVLTDPVKTAWGDWSLVEASFRLMHEALKDPSVSHFQLLSEACLPVRPLSEFVDYLHNEQADIMIDSLPLAEDVALFSHGWRYCSRSSGIRRVARKLTVVLWGEQRRHLPRAAVNLTLAGIPRSRLAFARTWCVRFVLRRIMRYAPGVDLTSGIESLAIGGQWFAANRRGMVWLLAARQTYGAFTQRYQAYPIPDESYIHSLVRFAGLRGAGLTVRPSNHALFWDTAGTGPDVLDDADEPRIRASGKFFARKFVLDQGNTLRSRFA